MIVIPAPFGNRINWDNTISTLGTFTKEYRGGMSYRLWRMLLTLRYYPGIGAWKNKLGLPNPGIDWLVRRVNNLQEKSVTRKIVSISARKTEDWWYLLEKAATLNPAAVELNVSCPNTDEVDCSEYNEVFYQATRKFSYRAIVKLPPINYMPIVEKAFNNGITSFHACNTLPTGNGGLSGKPLKPLSMQAIRDIKKVGCATHTLIGGGGVTTRRDVSDYLIVGASHVSVGSGLFFPSVRKQVKIWAKELRDALLKVPTSR